MQYFFFFFLVEMKCEFLIHNIMYNIYYFSKLNSCYGHDMIPIDNYYSLDYIE